MPCLLVCSNSGGVCERVGKLKVNGCECWSFRELLCIDGRLVEVMAAGGVVEGIVDTLGKGIGLEEETALLRMLKIYPDQLNTKTLGGVTYRSANSSGLSLQYEQDICQAVDLYNEGAVKGWSAFVTLPLTITHDNGKSKNSESKIFTLDPHTTGKDLVEAFGEPDRKGGGELLGGGGASGLGPGAWMEWQTLLFAGRHIYFMIELSGADARGAQRWDKDKGGVARWGVCTLSMPPSR